MTVPQVRTALAWLLHKACGCRRPWYADRLIARRLERKELARFYHCKKRNVLPPLRLKESEPSETVELDRFVALRTGGFGKPFENTAALATIGFPVIRTQLAICP